MSAAEVDRAEVLNEIAHLFHAYERALMSNDVEALTSYFWPDARLTRYGIADRQWGIDEMIAFRRSTAAPDFTRQLENLRISTFGDEFAVACVEFVRSDSRLRGFQSQTWSRVGARDGLHQGWRIVAAHVSMISFEG
jgi:hypothetical protein